MSQKKQRSNQITERQFWYLTTILAYLPSYARELTKSEASVIITAEKPRYKRDLSGASLNKQEPGRLTTD